MAVRAESTYSRVMQSTEGTVVNPRKETAFRRIAYIPRLIRMYRRQREWKRHDAFREARAARPARYR